MRNPFAATSQILAVSDCHLTDMNDARTSDFFAVCQWALEARPEYFLLLGDIFDFALGSKNYYQKKYHEVGDALSQLASAGIKVIYLEGNHEADVKYFGWPGVEFVTEGTHFITTQEGITLQMAHGDLIYSHNAYRRFRAVVKSAPFKWLVRQLPGALIDSLFLKTSAISRSQDDHRVFRHKELIETLERWLKDGGSQFGLFGHFHQPYGEWLPTSSSRSSDGGAAKGEQGEGRQQLVSVDSWDNPSVLSLEDGCFYRYTIRDQVLLSKERCTPILAADKDSLREPKPAEPKPAEHQRVLSSQSSIPQSDFS